MIENETFEYMSHGWGMGLSWLIFLFLIGVIIYFVRDDKKKESSAKEILDKRYTNGEISTKEYQEKLKSLQSSD